MLKDTQWNMNWQQKCSQWFWSAYTDADRPKSGKIHTSGISCTGHHINKLEWDHRSATRSESEWYIIDLSTFWIAWCQIWKFYAFHPQKASMGNSTALQPVYSTESFALSLHPTVFFQNSYWGLSGLVFRWSLSNTALSKEAPYGSIVLSPKQINPHRYESGQGICNLHFTLFRQW